MKEERGVIRTDQPKEGSKTKKYIRIAMILIIMAFFVLVFVMAALRRYGT
jgi:hypothetical protein